MLGMENCYWLAYIQCHGSPDIMSTLTLNNQSGFSIPRMENHYQFTYHQRLSSPYNISACHFPMILFVFFFFSLAWYLDEIAFHRIWFKALVKWYLYVDGNHKRRVVSVGTISHVVITCCHGTSVARTLKLFALPYYLSKNQEQSSYYLQTVAM